MDRKTLAALAVLLGGLFIVLVAIGALGSGLPAELLDDHKQAERDFDEFRFDSRSKSIGTMISENEAVLKAFGGLEEYRSRLAEAEKFYGSARGHVEKADRIVESGDAEAAEDLETSLMLVRRDLGRADENLIYVENGVKDQVVRWKSIQARYKKAEQELTSPRFEILKSEVVGRLKQESEFLSAYQPSPSWNDRVAEEQKVWASAGKELGESRALLKGNGVNEIKKIERLVESAEQKEARAIAGLEQVRDEVSTLLGYRDTRTEKVKAAKAAAAAIQSLPDTELKAAMEEAQTAFPDKAKLMEGWQAGFELQKREAKTLLTTVEQENQKAESNSKVDFIAIAKACNGLDELRKRANEENNTRRVRIKQLFIGWDKILVDMVIQDTRPFTYQHEIKVVTVDKDGNVTESKELKNVSEKEYKGHEQHLGMALESKPKGLFESEAIKTASAPGMSTVGNSYYGEWRQEGGHRRWHWHDRHRRYTRVIFVRHGPPVYYHSHWTTWRSYRRSRRVWYGSNRYNRPMFGSTGSWTRSSYAHARYNRSSGYKSMINRRRSGGTRRSGSSYGSRRGSSRSGYSSSRRSTPSRSRSSYSSSRYGSSSRRSSGSSYRRSSYSSSRSRSSSWGGSRRSGK